MVAKPSIFLFHARGDDIATHFHGWQMDVFTSDFPQYVRDVPCVYVPETTECVTGREEVLAFVQRHTPRQKARARVAASANGSPEKSGATTEEAPPSVVPTEAAPSKANANASKRVGKGTRKQKNTIVLDDAPLDTVSLPTIEPTMNSVATEGIENPSHPSSVDMNSSNALPATKSGARKPRPSKA